MFILYSLMLSLFFCALREHQSSILWRCGPHPLTPLLKLQFLIISFLQQNKSELDNKLNHIIIFLMAQTQGTLHKGELDQKVKQDEEHSADHPGQEKHIKAGEYIKSAVYGGLDGIITTLCVALSGYASGSTAKAILALGFSSLLADALSMAIADYLATKSDAEYMKSEEERQKVQIENDFEAEKKEMVHIYNEMGLKSEVSEEIVQILSQNKEGFLKVMMIEELQLIPDQENPFRNSLVTFFSFCFFGFFPMIPTIVAKVNEGAAGIESTKYIWITCLVAIFVLFVLGLSKSFVTGIKWYFSTIETIIIGALSAGASYGIGAAFGAKQ